MASDLNYGSVALLLHLDGAEGSKAFIDNSPRPKSVTGATGATTITTALSKFGGSSLGLNAFDKALDIPSSTDFDLGDTYTVELWAYTTLRYPTGGVVTRGVYDIQGTTWSGLTFGIRARGAFFRFYFYGTSSADEQYIDITGCCPQNTWQHIAMVRSGTNGAVYLDGVLAGSITGLNTPAASTKPLHIGTLDLLWNGSPANECFGDNIDEVRITKGVARYMANFAVPTEAFPDSAPAPSISGKIRDDTGAPCSRIVRAYRRDTGALVGSTTSDATTGAYTLTVTAATEVTVVVLDDAAGSTYNDMALRAVPA